MDEIAFAMKSCFAGFYLDGFDFIQGLALGFHLNEVKISSWHKAARRLATISLNQQKKRKLFGYKPICFLFLLIIWVWA